MISLMNAPMGLGSRPKQINNHDRTLKASRGGGNCLKFNHQNIPKPKMKTHAKKRHVEMDLKNIVSMISHGFPGYKPPLCHNVPVFSHNFPIYSQGFPIFFYILFHLFFHMFHGFLLFFHGFLIFSMVFPTISTSFPGPSVPPHRHATVSRV